MELLLIAVSVGVLIAFLTLCWRIIKTADTAFVRGSAQGLFILAGAVLVVQLLVFAIKIVMLIGYDLDARRAFKVFIANPVPAEVKELKGGGEVWQGYTAELRFSAEESFIKETLTDYTELPCEQTIVSRAFRESVTKCTEGDLSRCYHKKAKWMNGDLFLCWEETSKAVDFRAFASSD